MESATFVPPIITQTKLKILANRIPVLRVNTNTPMASASLVLTTRLWMMAAMSVSKMTAQPHTTNT